MPAFILQLLMMLGGMGAGRVAAGLGGRVASAIGGNAVSQLAGKTIIPAAAEGAKGLSKWLLPKSPFTAGDVGTLLAETAGFGAAMTGAEHFMSSTDNDSGPVYAAMNTPMPFARQNEQELQGVYSEQQLIALQEALSSLGVDLGGLT